MAGYRDMVQQVADYVGPYVDDYDVAGIVRAILEKYPDAADVDDDRMDDDDFIEIVQRYDLSAAA